MSFRTHLVFHSAKFPSYPNEEDDINPGLWGKRLAEYLHDQLKAFDIQTGEIFAEDFAWIVPIAHPLVSVRIACVNCQEKPGSYLLWILPAKPVVRKYFFKKIDMVPTITKIADALDKILSSDPEIHGVHWWDEK